MPIEKMKLIVFPLQLDQEDRTKISRNSSRQLLAQKQSYQYNASLSAFISKNERLSRKRERERETELG